MDDMVLEVNAQVSWKMLELLHANGSWYKIN